jgi:hypothetical protein
MTPTASTDLATDAALRRYYAERAATSCAGWRGRISGP